MLKIYTFNEDYFKAELPYVVFRDALFYARKTGGLFKITTTEGKSIHLNPDYIAYIDELEE